MVLFVAGILTGFGVGQLINKQEVKNEPRQADTVKKTIEEKNKKKELSSRMLKTS